MEHEHTPDTCPHCGSTDLEKTLTLTFKGSLVPAIELMAHRRQEPVDQFIYHLLWLESSKLPAARKLLEQEGEEHHA